MKVKKAIAVTVLTLGISSIGTAVQASEKANIPTDFNNIPSYAKSTIQKMYNQNLLNGFSDGTFKPTQELTRAEFFAMLLRVTEPGNIRGSGNYFEKEKMTKFEYEIIDKAYKAGYINGIGKVHEGGEIIMNPRSKITRQEIASVLFNAYQEEVFTHPESSDVEATLAKFMGDKHMISNWSEYALAKAIDLKLIMGTSETTLSPTKTASRTEAAVLIDRFFNKINSLPTVIEVSSEQTLAEFYDKQRLYIITEKDQNRPRVSFYNLEESKDNSQFKTVFPSSNYYSFVFSTNNTSIDGGYIEFLTNEDKAIVTKLILKRTWMQWIKTHTK